MNKEGLEVVTMNEGLELSTTMMDEEVLKDDDHDQSNETAISPEIHEITIPVEVGKDVRSKQVSRIQLLQREHQLYPINHDHIYISERLWFTMNCSVSLI